MMNVVLRSTLLCLGSLAVATHGDAAADEITNLPGWSGTSFKQYAGYVTVDAAHDRNLFYWFTEAEDPTSKPLVLWMNGGPGCSSVGGGLMSELGPFRPTRNGTLNSNTFAWNTVANVIYLESPAGVGFSFSGDKSDYTVGDNRTATDVYTFVLGFLERFPQYKDTPFWVSGESYGGHYVPASTRAIVEGNSKGDKPQINIQGFLVGNAWTVAEKDNMGAINYWLSHGLISIPTYNQMVANCDFATIGPLAMPKMKSQMQFKSLGANPELCDKAQQDAMTELGDINIYDIYADVYADCESGPLDSTEVVAEAGAPGTNSPAGCVVGYDPCVDSWTTQYLNRADVQDAIHANTSLPTKWSECSGIVDYSREDLLSSMIPTYQFLMAAGLKMLVYSGDVDAIVPVDGTLAWIESLKLDVKTPLAQWLVNKQVGGRFTEYETPSGKGRFAFTTVRNAGHMVPATQEERSLHMFKSWINQTPL